MNSYCTWFFISSKIKICHFRFDIHCSYPSYCINCVSHEVYKFEVKLCSHYHQLVYSTKSAKPNCVDIVSMVTLTGSRDLLFCTVSSVFEGATTVHKLLLNNTAQCLDLKLFNCLEWNVPACKCILSMLFWSRTKLGEGITLLAQTSAGSRHLFSLFVPSQATVGLMTWRKYIYFALVGSLSIYNNWCLHNGMHL